MEEQRARHADRGTHDLLSDPGARDLFRDGESRDVRQDPGSRDLLRDGGTRDATELGAFATAASSLGSDLLAASGRSGGHRLSGRGH